MLNIRNHLAASSLGSKIHAGAKLPRPSCRKRENKAAGICQVSVLFLPRRPLQHQLSLRQQTSTPTTQLIWGRRRGGGEGQWVGAQSRMQIHNQWNENTKDGGGGGSQVTCTYHPLPKCSGLHSSCRQMLNWTSADSSGLKRISEHPNNTKNSKQLKR